MSAAKAIIKVVLSILAMCAGVAAANATTITANFNGNSYQTISLNVATAGTVDLQYIDGYYDPVFVLFDGADHALIGNDDANGVVYSHITQNLAAGNYTLLVTYCCTAIDALTGSTPSNTDGFNSGSYYSGGTATLASVEAFLNTNPYTLSAGEQFSVAVTNAALGEEQDPVTPVPEPQSLALFGLALAALSMARRRQFGHK